MDTLDALEAFHGQFLAMSQDAFARGCQLPFRLTLTNGDGRVISTAHVEAANPVQGDSVMFEASIEDKIPREELWEAPEDQIFKLPLTITLTDKTGRNLSLSFSGEERTQ